MRRSANSEEAVGQVARGLCVGAYVGHDVGGGRISPLGVDSHQLVSGLPYRPARVRLRVPVLGQLSRSEQPHLARARRQNARLRHPGDTGVLGRGEGFCHSVRTLAETRLVEPGQRPAGVGIEVPFLFGQSLVQGLVDEGEGLPDGHRLAAGVQDPSVAGEDGHSRSDGGLC